MQSRPLPRPAGSARPPGYCRIPYNYTVDFMLYVVDSFRVYFPYLVRYRSLSVYSRANQSLELYYPGPVRRTPLRWESPSSQVQRGWAPSDRRAVHSVGCLLPGYKTHNDRWSYSSAAYSGYCCISGFQTGFCILASLSHPRKRHLSDNAESGSGGCKGCSRVPRCRG